MGAGRRCAFGWRTLDLTAAALHVPWTDVHVVQPEDVPNQIWRYGDEAHAHDYWPAAAPPTLTAWDE